MLYVHKEGSITFGGHNRYIEEGSVLLSAEEAAHYAANVLPAYRDKMRECATTMRHEALVIERSPQLKPAPGTINITPEPRGLIQLANEFDRYIERCNSEIAALQGPE